MRALPPCIQSKRRMRERARTDLCGGRRAIGVPTATTKHAPLVTSRLFRQGGYGPSKVHSFWAICSRFLLHSWAALRSDNVVELYHSIRKGLRGPQAQRHFTMPGCDEGNAFPDKRRQDVDDELINRVLVKEGTDDFTSAHHPDILAGLLAEAFGKCTDRLLDKLDAGRYERRGRAVREHIMQVICAEARAHLDAQVEGLTTKNLGIG